MAEKILNTRIQLKYDTLENWNNSTGILKAGEVAIATVPEGGSGQEVGSVTTPQVLVKVGDGKNTFANLPYITAKAGDVYAWAKAEKLGKDAFSAEVQKLFTDIENDITALEGKVGNTDVSAQISAAITAALKNLANGDAAVEKQFVTAAVQGENGKVVVSRRALVAEDIPTIGEGQVDGLTTKLSNINTAIEGINNAETGILATAKAYTDAEVKELADGQVATNKANIETLMGADAVEGSVAKALKDAKGYTDGQVTNAKTELQSYADQAEADALQAAKDYADAEIAKVTGGGEGSLSDLETRVGVIEGDYLKEEHRAALAAATAKVAEDLGKEVTRAGNAETALSGRLDTVEVFFESALKDSDGQQVIDTLKEIQDYIKSDETGAAAMAASIKANEDAIKVINGEATVEGSLAKVAADAAKAVEDEETRAKGEEARIEGLVTTAQGEVDAVEELVGTKTDADNVDTAFGRIAKAQKEVDALEVAVGAKTDAATAETVYGAIATEKARAEGVEDNLQTAINNEAGRAAGEEARIEGLANVAQSAADNAAAAAATADGKAVAAQNAIGTKNDAATAETVYGAIAAEKARAEGAEANLQTAINNLTTGMTTVSTTEGAGLKVTHEENSADYKVDIDETVTFVFNCGTSANLDPAQA